MNGVLVAELLWKHLKVWAGERFEWLKDIESATPDCGSQESPGNTIFTKCVENALVGSTPAFSIAQWLLFYIDFLKKLINLFILL